MNSSFDLAIFDLDGTLIEFHFEYLFEETERVLAEVGAAPVSREVLRQSFAAFDYFRFMHEERRTWFTEIFWERFNWANFPRPVPLPGAREVLVRLAELDIKTAIVTSRHTPPATLREELEHTGFMESVLHMICRTDETVHWSDKRANLLAMCKHMGCAPERTVMVGDTPADIVSAKEAGIGLAVAVLSGGIEKTILEQTRPDLILPDVTKLVEALGF